MINMKAGGCQLNSALLIVLFLKVYFYGTFSANEMQVCQLCSGTILNNSTVGNFCYSSAGWVEGRCCLKNDTLHETIIGLDLSNCFLTEIGNIQEAASAKIIDFSLNSIANISDATFQGFIELDLLILPVKVFCPGGAKSWKKIEVFDILRRCEGQSSMCNQTGQMSMDCPENSLCAPFGPGFFECSCVDHHHGYKCLREGEFPVLQVFGPLGASTVVLSLVLWITQRRKAKPL